MLTCLGLYALNTGDFIVIAIEADDLCVAVLLHLNGNVCVGKGYVQGNIVVKDSVKVTFANENNARKQDEWKQYRPDLSFSPLHQQPWHLLRSHAIAQPLGLVCALALRQQFQQPHPWLCVAWEQERA